MLAIAASAAALLAAWHSGPACTEVHGHGTLAINVGNLAPGSAKEFCYSDRAGERLRFLLARDAHGKVHAAFDACRSCYMYHEGYALLHGYVVCRVCGNRYRLSHLLKGRESCVPVGLRVALHGNMVDVKVSDIEKGRWLF